MRIHEKGVFKVVSSSSELEMWTMSGWRLVAVLDNSTVQTLTGYENVPIGFNSLYQANQGSYNTQGYPNLPYVTESRQVTTNHTIRTQTYLLLQDEQSAITTLTNKISEAEAKLNESSKVVKDHEARLKALQAELESTGVYMKGVCEDRDRWKGQVDILQKAYATFKEEVLEKLTQAAVVLEHDKERRRTSYERVVQGDFDGRVESVEAGSDG